MRDKRILLVKETATQPAFLDRTADLLRSLAPPFRGDLIVLMRNPLHAYLSMLEAQKKWWGGAHELTAETFGAWARHNRAALLRLLRLAGEFNAVLVSYEALVADKERLVRSLMRQLGVEFEERQLSFEKYVDKRQVRGDITIATEPFAISEERMQQRAAELAAAEERLVAAADFAEVGVARFHTPAAQRLVRPLREPLSG
jgi:sulfotransferase family protein